MEFLDGAKTFLGGLVLIGGGIAGMVFGVIDPVTGVGFVGSGLSVWGIGHKLEKLTQAQKDVNFNKHVDVATDKEVKITINPK